MRRAAWIAGVALLAWGAAIGPAHAQSEYETGYALGSKAYEYGIPIVDTDRIFRTNTSVSKPDHAGDAPVNRFSHARRARQAGEPGRGRPQPRHALLDRLAQPLAPAAGPARAEDAPLLRLRAGLPVDRELPQHRHDHRPGGRRRLCDRRPRVRRQAAARRDQGEVAVQPRLDDRAHLHQGRGRHRAGQQDPGLLRPPAAEDLRRDVPPAGDQAGRHDGRSSADRGARARPGSAPVLCLARQADDASSRRPRPTRRCSSS